MTITDEELDQLCCVPNARLAALIGALTINFNYVEQMERVFLEEYLRLDHDKIAAIAHSMSGPAVANLCRTLIADKEKDEELRTASIHYLENFAVLTENRNTAIHSLAFVSESGVLLSKRSRKGELKIVSLVQSELETCCKELKALFHFGATIQANFHNRRSGDRRVKLLPAPPRPEKLHLQLPRS
jgi:hypothetical protein